MLVGAEQDSGVVGFALALHCSALARLLARRLISH